MQTKEGASTCARAKFGDISAVAALLWDPKPSAGELSTRSPPSAALQQLAAACLCCYGDVPRALVPGIFLRTSKYYNCWILQVAASKRRAAHLSMDRAHSPDHNLTGQGGGSLHAAFLPGRALCAVLLGVAVCCCLKYLGFPTQKLCVFGSVFTCKFQ